MIIIFAYHVDRTNRLTVGQEINLNYVSIKPQFVMNNAISLYNGYLSYHGEQYSITNYNISDSSHTTEQIFELIRMKDFPNKVSRFQSFFAFSSLDHAKLFLEKHKNLNNRSCPIYKVEWNHDNFHYGDMNLVKGDSILQSYSLSHEYWSGLKKVDSIMEVLIKPPVKIVSRIIP